MKMFDRLIVLLFVLLIPGLLIFSCSKPKEGKAIVTEQEFFFHKSSDKGYDIWAKGKVKNVGKVDLKNVVVTSACGSCTTTLAPGRWMISGVEKTPDEKALINYLAVGQEAEFNLKGVATMFNTSAEEPQKPEDIKVFVESFEIAD